MTRVLLVAGDFVQTGGMDVANYALAKSLARSGCDVHLVTHRADESLAAESRVIIHLVPRPARSHLLGGPLLASAGRFWAWHGRKEPSRTIVNGGNCDLPDVNWVHYVHAAENSGFARDIVRTAQREIRRLLYLRAERHTIRRARIVIANSQRTRCDLIERVGVQEDKIKTVYYGVDPSRFFPIDDEAKMELRRELGWTLDCDYIVFVGSLGDRRKGFDTVFSAFAQLSRDSSWNAKLVVVGQGVELQAWKERALTCGLAQRILFLGLRSDVPRILRASNVLVAPSRYEAYGLGVHEALCSGIPALVSRDAGVAERYPRSLHNLLLDDPNDGPALAQKLDDWLQHRDEYQRIVSQLSLALRDHTWEAMASEIWSHVRARE